MTFQEAISAAIEAATRTAVPMAVRKIESPKGITAPADYHIVEHHAIMGAETRFGVVAIISHPQLPLPTAVIEYR